MGTRHQQKVINEKGEVKVSQYGQWDGYPSGQGKDILEFLRSANLDVYLQEVNKLVEATQKDYDRVNEFVHKVEKEIKDDSEIRQKLESNAEWFALDRDCGSKLHKLVYDGKVKCVELISNAEANLWCEGFYTINFQTNEFISEFNGKTVVCKLDDLPTVDSYLESF